LLESMAAVASETYTSVCAPVQYAAVTAFKGDVRIERYLWHARRILATLGARCHQKLADAGIRLVKPVGSFYLFLDFTPLAERLKLRGIADSATLCERLLAETGVAMLPGAVFQRQPSELSARIAYVDFDGAKALTASETVPLDQPLPNDFTDLWCFHVLAAIDQMVDWIASDGRRAPVADGISTGTR
jgi:aspartate aminotransferase